MPSAGRVTPSCQGGRGVHVPTLPRVPCCFWGIRGPGPTTGCAHGCALLPSAPARVLPLCLGAQAPPSVHPSAVCVDVSAPFHPQASCGRVQPGLLCVSVSAWFTVSSWPRADPGGRGLGRDCPGGGSVAPSTICPAQARAEHGRGCWTLSGAEAGGRTGRGSLGRSLGVGNGVSRARYPTAPQW